VLVASELELPEDWLNDGAKGFLNGLTIGPLLLSAPGIQVHQVTPEQLLAMKLSAWRDDTDINDARRLMLEFPNFELEALWAKIEPFVIRGEELKARYALEDLWNALQT
jgi:predicted nucleotidyltransferase